MLTTLMLTLLTGLTGAQAPPIGEKQDPPKKVEIFAAEDFYKQEKAKEQEFVGQIQRADKGGKAGFGRFNPYRLMVITYQDVTKETIVNGKVVRETVKVPYATVYEIYIAGKGELLEPFLGKEVKVIGKPVSMEVEGRKHNEVWPARVELIEPKKVETPGDDACCGDDKDTPVKIVAKARWPFVSSAPNSDKQGKQLVIRSATELVANSPYKDRDARPEVVEKMATEEIAKLLSVKDIDWKNQMLVVVTAGVKNTGGRKIEIVSVTAADKVVTVNYLLSPPMGAATQAFTHPSVMALVERAAGEPRFVQTPADKINLKK